MQKLSHTFEYTYVMSPKVLSERHKSWPAIGFDSERVISSRGFTGYDSREIHSLGGCVFGLLLICDSPALSMTTGLCVVMKSSHLVVQT